LATASPRPPCGTRRLSVCGRPLVLFAAFAWAELVYSGRTIPAQLALMAIVYSLITWTGMFLFGRAVWLRHGDPFAAAFGTLARFAPTEVRVTNRRVCRQCATGCGQDEACINCGECFDRAGPAEREWNLRPYGAGLLRPGDVSISAIGFVLLLLSTVTFDGFTATPAWAALERGLYTALTPSGARASR
jgi:polyferredoxin